jgi:peptide methionine sulfoxide reductase msrA/msrB
MRRFQSALTLVAVLVLVASCGGDASAGGAAPPAATPASGKVDVATLAGGCFWCIESAFDDVPGVIQATSGYTGAESAKPPTYAQVSTGTTGYYESVQVRFDPAKISYARLLDIFWRQIDPTDAGGQFADRGSQYRTAIFVHDAEQRRVAEASKAFLEKSRWFDKPIVTEILPATKFYPAEEHHQKYCKKHPAAFQAYERGSGRGPYVDEFWKDKAPIGPAAAYTKPSDEELKKRLTPLQYAVTQQCGTEPAFDNAYWNNHAPGIYVDVVSGEPLFSSKDKYDSGSGWPSFTKPIDSSAVVRTDETSVDGAGIEIKSSDAKSHLGHVFPDGPRPTGLRFCIDSAALRFIPADKLVEEGYGEYAKDFPGTVPKNSE